MRRSCALALSCVALALFVACGEQAADPSGSGGSPPAKGDTTAGAGGAGGGGGEGGGVDLPDPMPDFSLVDVNPSSVTHGQAVSPRDYEGNISAWYFGHADCQICTAQFAWLNQLQSELDNGDYPVDIDILGINKVGYEEYNDKFTTGRFLPWLQDTEEQFVWKAWKAHWRDLVVLDTKNRKLLVYNLTEHDLNEEENYAELKGILASAARGELVVTSD